MSLSKARRSLGARQRRFVDEYLIDCNATRAAMAAGYTKRTAAQAGWEVLRNPKVADELSRRQRQLAVRHAVTIDNVISELAKVGFSNAADFYAVEDGRLSVDLEALTDPAKAAAVSQIEVSENKDGGQVVKFKLFDKRAALGDLSNHLALGRGLVLREPTRADGDAEINIRELALAAIAMLTEADEVAGRGRQIEGYAVQVENDELDLDEE